MNSVERLIRSKLEPAVAAGIGEWGDSTITTLGRAIYSAADGEFTIVLYDEGLRYANGSQLSFQCRYDEVAAVKLPSLIQLAQLRGDLDKTLSLELTRQSDSHPYSLELSLRIYSQVASVLARIINDLAPRRKVAPVP